MKINLCLTWAKKSEVPRRAFKSSQAYELCEEYKDRIGHFDNCQIQSGPYDHKEFQKSGAKLWICDPDSKHQGLSSEKLSKHIQDLKNSGVRQLYILIGGPNGFSKSERELMKPDFCWSFGPLTLPHELAAVVALEQVYRALTINNHLPYHTGH